ncbi:MAG: GNAT family N-acetyltransferase [Candidatus Sulfotelmatobacter sp.]
MSSAPQKPECALSVPERRFHARRRVQSLAYVNVGTSRGVVFDISEGGLGVHAAAPEIEAHSSTVAFHLPGSQDTVEIRGQIAWLSESKKEAGIRFLDPPETVRSRVQEWTSLINPAEAGLHLYVGESAAMSVYELNPLDDPRWETFVHNHARASVFHSTNWLRALQIAYGYDPAVVTTNPRQAALTNGLVFCRVESWLTGRRMVSLPFSDHCEPLGNNSGELDDLLFSMRHDVDTGSWKYIEIRPPFYQPCSLTGFGKSLTYCLHRLNLSGRSAQELFHNFHKSCVQRKIRRAERERLKYEEGTSEVLLQQFYKLLVVTRRRLLLPPQPQSWFRALIASFGEDLKIRVVSKDDRPVASILTISHKKTMVYKYGCSDARFNRLGGMALLLWNTIQEAKDKGLEEFEMGRSDSSTPGLISFKEHWGAVGTQLNYWRYPSQPVGTANAWQQSILRRLVPATPNSVLRMIGMLLYRHIG